MPTNRSVARKDHADIVYRTENAKFDAVVEEIVHEHESGRPVLVGTRSIEKSERLAMLLRRRGVECNVLNAKYHEQEAQIIKDAGQWGAVTIATNMAGRGVDIKLGEGVAAVGGLHIIGTERHESRPHRQSVTRPRRASGRSWFDTLLYCARRRAHAAFRRRAHSKDDGLRKVHR